MVSKCINCNKAFVEGDMLQAFLRSKDDEEGSWTDPICVDVLFQERINSNNDKFRRRHYIERENKNEI